MTIVENPPSRDKVLKNKARWLKLKPEEKKDFETFVKYVITECTTNVQNKKKINTHWRPFYAKCEYCDMKYDVIGRAETFIDDTR